MSTPVPAPATEPADRGTLRIDHTVVRKLAERAADGVDGTTVVERRLAGLGAGRHGAHIKIEGHGNTLDLSLDIPLSYPAPLAEIVENLRAAVTGAVEDYTSYQVRSLAVTVSALRSETDVRVR